MRRPAKALDASPRGFDPTLSAWTARFKHVRAHAFPRKRVWVVVVGFGAWLSPGESETRRWDAGTKLVLDL